MADQTLATLTSSLEALEAERTAILQRAEALERAIDGLRAAVGSLDGTSATATAPSKPGPAPRRKEAAKPRPRPSGPKVGADDLVDALRVHGGSATTAQLVSSLGVNDGRNLNGARRLAVDAGLVVVDDGTYRLVDEGDDLADRDGASSDETASDEPTSNETASNETASNETAGDAATPQQASLSDDEWEASGTPAVDGDELGRRFP